MAPFMDYLEAVGNQVDRLGLPNRKNTPDAVTGVTSVLSGIGAGIKTKRALDTARALKKQKDDFEKKTGMSFDLFSKLSSGAQTEILKNSGVLSDPMSEPLPDFGGRSSSDLMAKGAPGRTMTVPGGTGVFGGLPSAEVQVSPPLPPLSAIGAGSRKSAVDAYLGVDAPVDPSKQNLIETRTANQAMRERESKARMDLMKQRGQLIETQTAATRALAHRRSAPDEPIDDWEAGVARKMGVIIPEGARPTRKQFDSLLKYNRPAMAVLQATDRLSLQALQAEKSLGRQLTERELSDVVKRETGDLPTLAGPKSVSIALEAIRQNLARMRAEPDLFNQPAGGEEDQIPEDQIPSELDAEDEEVVPDDEETEDPPRRRTQSDYDPLGGAGR